jgi:hypothetical protein
LKICTYLGVLSEKKEKENDIMQAEVEASVEEFGIALTEVEALLEPLMNESYRELLARLPPMDAAKLNVMIAYTINSLYYSTHITFSKLICLCYFESDLTSHIPSSSVIEDSRSTNKETSSPKGARSRTKLCRKTERTL